MTEDLTTADPEAGTHREPESEPAREPDEGDPNAEPSTVPEKRYKDLQAQFTKVTQENAEQRDRLSRLEGRLDERSNAASPEDPPPSFWDWSDEEQEEIADNPALMRTKMAQWEAQSNERYATVLTDMQQQHDREMAELRAEIGKNKPERAAWQPIIDKLREDPEIERLKYTDDQLMDIARREGMKPDFEFQGAPGAGARPRVAQRPKAASPAERQRAYNNFLAIKGDPKEAERLTKKHFNEG